MPEGHTIHRLAQDHRALLGGLAVRASSPQGRFDAGARDIDGRVVLEVAAAGKHLLYRFEGLGPVLHVHLGLFGKFRRSRQPAPPARGAVRLRLETEDTCLDLSGPTACELLQPEARDALLARLGPDVLDPRARRGPAYVRIARSSRPLGALLLDQSILGGVGNVYRAEALFLAGLHPEIPGRDVTDSDFARLWQLLRRLLKEGVRRRAIITVDESRPRRGERTWVYRQRLCRRCGEPVSKWLLGGRTMYACPECQRR